MTGRNAGRIEIGTQANRHEVILEITDDGCGIPEEIHSRIFDAFFTTKPVGEGTGLGLSISHSIVSDHGGRIELESAPARVPASVSYCPLTEREQGSREVACHRLASRHFPSRSRHWFGRNLAL